ncbi:MAG: type II secretion system F family protein [Holosporaceae bacterium]|jgi:tight adherence protein C|nr:type II secretion system F family protein [Holosporaceae bacterium]
MLIDILCFIITFCVFYLLRPYANRLYVDAVLKLRLIRRIIRVKEKGKDVSSAAIDEVEGENVLNRDSAEFHDNIILRLIAKYAPAVITDMRLTLQRAGQRGDNALEELVKSKAICSVALFSISLVMMTIADMVDISLDIALLGSLALGGLGGTRLVDFNMSIIAKKRVKLINRGTSDLIDLLIICTESGLDLNRSIIRIAREMRMSNPVLADELSLTAIELEMIPDYHIVFNNLENRTNCPEIKILSKTLSQSIEYGSSLNTALRDLANDSRQKRMLRAEAAAAAAPTLLTLPMMLFTMPCLFIVMLGPVILGMIKSAS